MSSDKNAIKSFLNCNTEDKVRLPEREGSLNENIWTECLHIKKIIKSENKFIKPLFINSITSSWSSSKVNKVVTQ